MQKLSGLVLDVYDDPSGDVLRTIFPTPADLPEVVKEAHHLSEAERSQLPSDSFALELIDGETVLRKYACVDEGNTALNVEYFLKVAHKLPSEAQKVAARNLTTACDWYGIPVPEPLEKMALGIGTMIAAPFVVPGQYRQAKKNMQAARASGGSINPAIVGQGPQGMIPESGAQ